MKFKSTTILALTSLLINPGVLAGVPQMPQQLAATSAGSAIASQQMSLLNSLNEFEYNFNEIRNAQNRQDTVSVIRKMKGNLVHASGSMTSL